MPRTPVLDRRIQFDEKSRAYPVRTLLADPERVRSFTWTCSVWLNQCPEDESKRCGGGCVGMSTAAEAAARPVVVEGVTEDLAWRLYDLAQEKYDPPEYNTPPEEGTSVLAGLKAMQELGLLDQYRWGFGLKDVVQAVAYKGPAILGIWWREGMMEPDANGFIHATGQNVGGHAILMNQVRIVLLDKARGYVWDNVDLDKSWAGLHQSWGNTENWKLSLRELGELLADDGEAAIPVRRRKPVLAAA